MDACPLLAYLRERDISKVPSGEGVCSTVTAYLNDEHCFPCDESSMTVWREFVETGCDDKVRLANKKHLKTHLIKKGPSGKEFKLGQYTHYKIEPDYSQNGREAALENALSGRYYLCEDTWSMTCVDEHHGPWTKFKWVAVATKSKKGVAGVPAVSGTTAVFSLYF